MVEAAAVAADKLASPIVPDVRGVLLECETSRFVCIAS